MKIECSYIKEVSGYGQKLSPHPSLKIHRNAQDSITKQIKALCLTVEELTSFDVDDPLVGQSVSPRTASTRLRRRS